MKKIIIALLIVLITTVFVLKAFISGEHYSNAEEQAIAFANLAVEEQYGQKINTKDFSYCIGKPIGDNDYVSLDSDATQEEKYQNIVSVHALRTNKMEKNDIYTLTVLYNKESNEIIDLSAEIL